MDDAALRGPYSAFGAFLQIGWMPRWPIRSAEIRGEGEGGRQSGRNGNPPRHWCPSRLGCDATPDRCPMRLRIRCFIEKESVNPFFLRWSTDRTRYARRRCTAHVQAGCRRRSEASRGRLWHPGMPADVAQCLFDDPIDDQCLVVPGSMVASTSTAVSRCDSVAKFSANSRTAGARPSMLSPVDGRRFVDQASLQRGSLVQHRGDAVALGDEFGIGARKFRFDERDVQLRRRQ